jgi:hypothetical protein
VNIINDTAFLNSILIALRKIVNLSNNFAKFKETILLTNTIDIPKSISSTAIAINQVSDEIDCAMQYISNFATPDPSLTKGKLSYADKLIIQKATTTINSWNSIVSNGVSVTMANNTDIQYISIVLYSIVDKYILECRDTDIHLHRQRSPPRAPPPPFPRGNVSDSGDAAVLVMQRRCGGISNARAPPDG